MNDLTTDPAREGYGPTDIYVRAKRGDRWDSVDIAELDAPSLLAWLRSRGGENRWAESVVGILLGHDSIHPAEPTTPEGTAP